jgi:hypothetical protein
MAHHKVWICVYRPVRLDSCDVSGCGRVRTLLLSDHFRNYGPAAEPNVARSKVRARTKGSKAVTSGLSQSNYYYVEFVFTMCPSLASHSTYPNNSGSI